MKAILFLERALPIFFWVLVMFGFDSPIGAILTISAAVLHELGHILTTVLFTNKRAALPTSNITGFRIKFDTLSYREELFVALGGPLMNLAIGLPLAFVSAGNPALAYLKTFGVINLVTMASNLFPIETFDGYRILSSLFGIFAPPGLHFDVFLSTLSFAFSAVMCFLSLYFILKLGEGYWIFIIFFSLLLSAIAKRQKRTIWENK